MDPLEVDDDRTEHCWEASETPAADSGGEVSGLVGGGDRSGHPAQGLFRAISPGGLDPRIQICNQQVIGSIPVPGSNPQMRTMLQILSGGC